MSSFSPNFNAAPGTHRFSAEKNATSAHSPISLFGIDNETLNKLENSNITLQAAATANTNRRHNRSRSAGSNRRKLSHSSNTSRQYAVNYHRTLQSNSSVSDQEPQFLLFPSGLDSFTSPLSSSLTEVQGVSTPVDAEAEALFSSARVDDDNPFSLRTDTLSAPPVKTVPLTEQEKRKSGLLNVMGLTNSSDLLPFFQVDHFSPEHDGQVVDAAPAAAVPLSSPLKQSTHHRQQKRAVPTIHPDQPVYSNILRQSCGLASPTKSSHRHHYHSRSSGTRRLFTKSASSIHEQHHVPMEDDKPSFKKGNVPPRTAKHTSMQQKIGQMEQKRRGVGRPRQTTGRSRSQSFGGGPLPVPTKTSSAPTSSSSSKSSTSSLAKNSSTSSLAKNSSTSCSKNSSTSSSKNSSTKKDALPTFRNFVQAGIIYDGFIIRPKRVANATFLHQVVRAEGIVRVYTDAKLGMRWKIECRQNGKVIKQVDSPTAFASWYQREVEGRQNYCSRKPYRELVFLDHRLGTYWKSGNEFRQRKPGLPIPDFLPPGLNHNAHQQQKQQQKDVIAASAFPLTKSKGRSRSRSQVGSGYNNLTHFSNLSLQPSPNRGHKKRRSDGALGERRRHKRSRSPQKASSSSSMSHHRRSRSTTSILEPLPSNSPQSLFETFGPH